MYENYNEAQITRYMKMADDYKKLFDNAQRHSAKSQASQALQRLEELGFTPGMERPTLEPIEKVTAKKARKLAGKVEEGSASGREREELSKYISDNSSGANNLLVN